MIKFILPFESFFEKHNVFMLEHSEHLDFSHSGLFDYFILFSVLSEFLYGNWNMPINSEINILMQIR